MPPSDKKREQIRRTPKSFRSTIETDLALPLILEARNRELSEAGVDDKLTSSDLFNEWVKNEWVRLREQNKIEPPIVDPYLTEDLGDNYRQRIPVRVGDEVVKGYQKTVPNLTIRDLEELYELGHLKDPQQLVSLGGAIELHRYEDEQKNDIDCYRTALGNFLRKWTKDGKPDWSYEPSSERAMTVSSQDVTEEEIEGATRIGVSGVSGLYWSEMKSHSGQRFWDYGPVVNMVAAPLSKEGSPEIEAKIPADLAKDFKTVVSRVCDRVSLVTKGEAEIVRHCLGIVGEEHGLQQTANDLQAELGKVRGAVFGAIRRACMIRMQLQLPDVFFGKQLNRDMPYMRKPVNGYTATDLAKVFLPSFEPDSAEHQWIKRLIEEEAADTIRAGKAECVSKEVGKDGSEHRVYHFCPDVILKPHQDPKTVWGALGCWEIHAHRGPFDTEASYVARQKSVDYGEGLKFLLPYPEAGARGGTWLEYRMMGGDHSSVALLESPSGELVDVVVFSFETYVQIIDSAKQFSADTLDLWKKFNRHPTDVELGRELGVSAATVRNRQEAFGRVRNRMTSRQIRIQLSMFWADQVEFNGDRGMDIDWQEPYAKKPVGERDEALARKIVMSASEVHYQQTPGGLDLSEYSFDMAFRSNRENPAHFVRLHKDGGGPLGTLVDIGPLKEDQFIELMSRLRVQKAISSMRSSLGSSESEDSSPLVFGFDYHTPEHGNLRESNRHIKALKKSIDSLKAPQARGMGVREWASRVTGDTALLSKLPLKALTRQELREYCQLASTDCRAVMLATLCWNETHVTVAKGIWSQRSEWDNLLEDILNSEFEPNEIYHHLAHLGAENWLLDANGLFSCIAHFSDPLGQALIMDYTTSVSANLICGRDIVPDPLSFQAGFRIRHPYKGRQKLHPSVYKYFNKFMNDLAGFVGHPPGLVLDAMMDRSEESFWKTHLEEEMELGKWGQLWDAEEGE